MKRLFRCKVTYFRPSGQYFLGLELTLVARDIGSIETEEGLTPPVAYEEDLAEYVRENLPGLDGLEEAWSGHILVECNRNHPLLIVGARS